jgi:hypothetical protein
MTKLQSGHEFVSSNSSRENEYLQTISVTLTLKVGTWVFIKTHRLDVVDIYALLFWNPSMHDKVTARTRMCVPINSKCDKLKFKMVVWPWPLRKRRVILRRDTSAWCGRHLCLVILKSFNAWQSYSPDTYICIIFSKLR